MQPLKASYKNRLYSSKKHTQKASQSPNRKKSKSKKCLKAVFVNIQNVIKISKYFANGIEKTRENTKQGEPAFCQYIPADKSTNAKEKKNTPHAPNIRKSGKKHAFCFQINTFTIISQNRSYN